MGMGRDFYQAYPAARALFEEAAAVMGPEILNVIFEGPEEKLQLTEYTQPAILTVSTAIGAVLADRGFKPDALAGLSLGEYSALVSAGSISFAEALPLVSKRGIYMQEAVPAGAGKMMAIMGISHEEVEKACAAVEGAGHVSPANYNCPGQTVISGSNDAVDRAVELARQAGAKRISPLKVSAPFHCALLDPVCSQMAAELEKIKLHKPAVPVYFNVSAQIASDPVKIKENLVRQVSSPILWSALIGNMIDAGVDTFIGIGPGDSLSRLMKRIAPEKNAYSVEDCAALEQLLESAPTEVKDENGS